MEQDEQSHEEQEDEEKKQMPHPKKHRAQKDLATKHKPAVVQDEEEAHAAQDSHAASALPSAGHVHFGKVIRKDGKLQNERVTHYRPDGSVQIMELVEKEETESKDNQQMVPASSKVDGAASTDAQEEQQQQQKPSTALAVVVPSSNGQTTWSKKEVEQISSVFKRVEKISPAIRSAQTIVMLINDDFPDPSEHIMKVLQHTTFCFEMMKHGKILTNCPNTAALLESIYYHRKIHFFEMWQNVHSELQVAYSKGKPGKEAYINIGVKYPQNWCGLVLGEGYHFVTPFSKVPAFVQWGPTKDTGVEGSFERIINGKKVSAAGASYGNMLDNSMWHPHIINSDYDDSVMSTFLMWIEKVLFPDIAMKTFAFPDSMAKARERVMTQVKQNSNLKAPTTNEEFARLCMESPSFKLCMSHSQTSATFDVGTSVHRRAHDTYDKNKNRDTSKDEDLTKIPFPTPMFEKESCRINELDNKRMTHFRVPMVKARRPQDVDPVRAALPFGHKDAYTGASEVVEFENAVITRGDVVCNLVQPSLYEDKFDKAGGKGRLKGWGWLTTQQQLNDLLAKGPVPAVDPRFSNPCAGIYEGPVDKLKKNNSAYHANVTANTAASAAAARASHVTDDEMTAAADAAAAAFVSKV
jgi:hypothetical protein